MTTYSNGYVVVLARCVDLLAAGVISRKYGVTLSSFTGKELRRPNPKLWARVLGGFLNGLQYGIEMLLRKPHALTHCEGAIQSDLERAVQAQVYLNSDHGPGNPLVVPAVRVPLPCLNCGMSLENCDHLQTRKCCSSCHHILP